MTRPVFNKMHFNIFMMIAFAMAMIFPDVALAAGAAEDLVRELKDDPSAAILAYVFGDVGGLFGTGTNTIFSAMFGVFNSGMMAVGGCLVGYTVLSGTLRTAHEGELLGRQWSSVWIPLRSAIGMAMVLPGPGGYALVQVFMMFCALVGISLGNTVWDAATKFASFGSTEITIISDSNKVVNAVLDGVSCSARLAYNKSTTNPQSIASGDIQKPIVTMVNNAISVKFGDASGKCGTITLPIRGTGHAEVDEIFTYKASQAIDSFNILSGPIANILNNQTITDGDRKAVLEAYRSYDKNVSAFAKEAYKAAAKKDDFMQMVKAQGWMFAGATWVNTTERITKTQNAVSSSAEVSGIPYNTFEPEAEAEVRSTVSMISVMKAAQVNKEVQGIASSAAGAGSFNDKVQKVKDSVDLAESHITLMDLASNGSASVMEMILFPIGALIGAFFSSVDNVFLGGANALLPGAFNSMFAGDTDPLLRFAEFGNILVTIGTLVFIKVGALLSVGAAFPKLGITAATFANWIAPFANMLMMAITAAGMSFSVYIPMSPALVWIMAVAGWMVLVFESMIAAPLWAVMHASPEGHEWSGKGAQGYMIVLGLILRPGLMIFGLVGAMIYLRVFLTFAAIMMSIAVTSLDTAPGIGGFIGPIGMLFLFAMFTFISVKLVNRALMMVNEIPSSIMKWVGGGHDPLGDDAQHEGKSFVGGIIGRGENAAQAALGAAGGSKNSVNDKLDMIMGRMGIAGQENGGGSKPTAESNKMNDDLMGKSTSTKK